MMGAWLSLRAQMRISVVLAPGLSAQSGSKGLQTVLTIELGSLPDGWELNSRALGVRFESPYRRSGWVSYRLAGKLGWKVRSRVASWSGWVMVRTGKGVVFRTTQKHDIKPEQTQFPSRTAPRVRSSLTLALRIVLTLASWPALVLARFPQRYRAFSLAHTRARLPRMFSPARALVIVALISGNAG
ncbi:hypothetical protein MA16_Dca020284 [Dendrobium catenatum]|uniref:Uncharacterized protein n=1 Tax=Dendrobium catenatum TaxID=906689 RepID=A0A2I0X474_9ASPA|nr:hypothetical protein MA16_Dca020284 [Dendrobium catenatum]